MAESEGKTAASQPLPHLSIPLLSWRRLLGRRRPLAQLYRFINDRTNANSSYELTGGGGLDERKPFAGSMAVTC